MVVYTSKIIWVSAPGQAVYDDEEAQQDDKQGPEAPHMHHPPHSSDEVREPPDDDEQPEQDADDRYSPSSAEADVVLVSPATGPVDRLPQRGVAFHASLGVVIVLGPASAAVDQLDHLSDPWNSDTKM